MPLLPMRRCFSKSSWSGSPATSERLTRRCAPLATSVTTMAARRAARSLLSVVKMASFTCASRKWASGDCDARASLDLLQIDPDGAAAGEPDLPGGLVGDAEFERLGRARLDHVERFGHHRAFHAAARDRAQEIALVVDDQVRADRPRRRAPGLHHGGERHAAPGLAPVLGGFEDVFVAGECAHGCLSDQITCHRIIYDIGIAYPTCPGLEPGPFQILSQFFSALNRGVPGSGFGAGPVQGRPRGGAVVLFPDAVRRVAL